MDEMMNFERLFAADQEPERLAFTVQGRECWVELQPMNSMDHDSFATKGLTYSQSTGGVQVAQGELDLATRNLFLVSRTLRDFCLMRPARALNSEGETVWSELRPPERERDRLRFVEEVLRGTDPAFWDWLVFHCHRVNGLLPDQQGN